MSFEVLGKGVFFGVRKYKISKIEFRNIIRFESKYGELRDYRDGRMGM